MAVNVWSSLRTPELVQLARLRLFLVSGYNVRRTHQRAALFRTVGNLHTADISCAGNPPCGRRVAVAAATAPPRLPPFRRFSHLSAEIRAGGQPSQDAVQALGTGQCRGRLRNQTASLHALTLRSFHQSPAALAGHNKWSKVKHIKGPKDAQRSLMFNKIILQMRIAIREAGPNPEVNSSLASLVSQAKAKAMPKATIEGVLKNAARKGSGGDADTQLLLEVRGPGQSCFLIDILTDNARRTKNEIQHILNKNGGTFGTSLYAFKRKGVVKVSPQGEGQAEPLTLDLATEVAIEVGAEDVQETSSDDDTPQFMFICDMGDLRAVRNNLASLSYCIESAAFEYLPETTVALGTSILEDTFRLISLLNDNPSVVKIYDNVESSDLDSP